MSIIVIDATGRLLDKIQSLLSRQIRLLGGFEDELEMGERTVVAVRSLLSEAEEKQAKNQLVKMWLGQLRDVVYDWDDLLEDISTESLRRRLITAEVCLPILAHGIKFRRKIIIIRQRLENIIADAERLHLRELFKETPLREREHTHSFVDETSVFGRNVEREKILEILLSRGIENVCVVPIVGIGGIGKTALAQLVYNDPAIRSYFHKCLWVFVSDVFDLKVIVERALASATDVQREGLELDKLQISLRQALRDQRCLIVLDGVWNTDRNRWLELKNILTCGAGSAIIVTTRSSGVAEITRTVPPFFLQGLPIDLSLSLFYKVAAVDEELRREEDFEIAKEIMKKTSGVPLAVKMLGSQLFQKPKNELLSSLKNELSSIHLRETFLPSLKLSFDHLPSHLKRCFAYCSIFPRGCDINVQGLIHLWIAEGFVRSSSSVEHLEDIGLAYFEDLSSGCFFQDVEKDRLGNYVKCKMHDLMHDLATFVAGEETELSNSTAQNIKIKTRHASIEFDSDDGIPWKVPTSLFKASKLRTLLLLTKPPALTFQTSSRFEIEEAQLVAIFYKLGRLMVLDLHHFKIRRIPRSIRFLKHLRYLDLSHNNCIKRLPKCIVDLLNLQELNLSYCEKLEELPGDIDRLVNLMHLKFEGCWKLSHMPRGLGKLTCLQTLTWFIVPSYTSMYIGGLSELKQLNSLRGRLEIRNLGILRGEESEFFPANMKEKQHLQSLSLCWNRDDDEEGNLDPDFDEKSLENLRPHANLKEFYIYDYAGLRFPSNFSCLSNLITIWIQDCKKCKYLPQLHEFPVLTTLVIRGLTDLEYIDNEEPNPRTVREGSMFFPSLKTLWLSKCANLKGWQIERYADPATVPQFPCLSSLHIQECPEIRWMPSFPSLDDLLWLDNSPPCFFPLSKLKKLYIERIEDLETLSEEWCQTLNCLRELIICDCPDFMELPRSMHQKSSLQLLDIRGCPYSKEACKGKNGRTWPDIAHIPNILIDNEEIQLEGHYMLEDEDSLLSIEGSCYEPSNQQPSRQASLFQKEEKEQISIGV